MGITVQHGPSMLPVGKLAYRTGQNEYIKERRKELEALAEKRAARQQKSQMQVNDINAGFQQIQMQHQQGMQRAAAHNEFQLDRDQRNQDWNVKAAGDLFNNQKDLNDQRHQQGLGRIEFGQDLQNQAMIANNQAQDMAETIDRLYGTSNQAGRDKINQFQAQQIKLRGHVTEGKITQEQYDAQYSEAKGTLMNDLTGKNSELYQIGADLQVGGESIVQGGALKKVIGEGGAVIYQRNYGPEVEGEDKDEVWEDTYQQVRFNGPDDMIGYKNIYNMHTGEVTQQSMLPEWKAQQEAKLKAIEFQADQRRTVAGATKSETLKSANEAVTQLTIAYENRVGPNPYKTVGGYIDEKERIAIAAWREGLDTFKKSNLTQEQQIAVGMIEPGDELGGMVGQGGGGQGVAEYLPTGPEAATARGFDKYPTVAERARHEDFQSLPLDTSALPPGVSGSTMEIQNPGREGSTTSDMMGGAMQYDDGIPYMPPPGQPALNEGAAFDNKLNYLNSMNI
jgi:hypothetical protein